MTEPDPNKAPDATSAGTPDALRTSAHLAAVSTPDAGATASGAAATTPQPGARPRRRRVTTQPVPGSDPNPAPEAPRHTLEENDARLKAEKPPHY